MNRPVAVVYASRFDALLLASDEAWYLTGATIVADGGVLAGIAGAPAEE